jgi:hypothetical protein
MGLNKSAYHYYTYQKENTTIIPEPFPNDGKKLLQLQVLSWVESSKFDN